MIRPIGRLRSVLFAPAVRSDFIAKLGQYGADMVVIDCEDATPAHAKALGRENARVLSADVAAVVPVMVRVNSPTTDWFDADIAEGLNDSLTAVIVPKVESVVILDHIATTLTKCGLADLGVVVGLETALGVADARQILGHPRVVAGYFGAEDFIADMGGVRTESNHEVAYARSRVALAGRLAMVPVVDQVVTDFRDDERFVREAGEARAMGYSGKLCIHPAQVDLARRGFMPSDAEVERAQRLLRAFEEATARGVAAINFEGQMVDAPLATQARRIIDVASDSR